LLAHDAEPSVNQAKSSSLSPISVLITFASFCKKGRNYLFILAYGFRGLSPWVFGPRDFGGRSVAELLLYLMVNRK
jgi:hypothetical protein